jgi:hypothetical protein
MKKQMAYPPGMLVRKDGNIRFQYRIPKDLLQHYPRPIVSENLGTSDKALAARMIYARRAELDVASRRFWHPFAFFLPDSPVPRKPKMARKLSLSATHRPPGKPIL